MACSLGVPEVLGDSSGPGAQSAPPPASSLTRPLMSQVEQLYVRQLVEEAGKGCGPGSLMQAPEEPPPDQVFRMFPEICVSHQRPFFRENQQITV